MQFWRWTKRVSNIIYAILVLFIAFIYNEFVIYYIVQYKCDWPSLSGNQNKETLKALFIADTHLLGPFRGHWFDKLRREWQMHRAYLTAVSYTTPDVVFFLGDIFDEGQWVNDIQFDDYVQRFHKLFPQNPGFQQQIIVGNHDIGFHYATNGKLLKRFDNAFSTESTELKTLKNVTFVTVNSVAMEGDGCHLCKDAVEKLEFISKKLKKDKQYPVLLQHFPLYRESDESCNGEDSAPEGEKHQPFRPKWDCLSQSSTHWLLENINPRLILSGHTHHGCAYQHGDIMEYSVPSFSWRNRNNPSYLLATFTPEDFSLSKCFIPRESTVICVYEIAAALSFLCLIWRFLPRFYWKRDRCKTS